MHCASSRFFCLAVNFKHLIGASVCILCDMFDLLDKSFVKGTFAVSTTSTIRSIGTKKRMLPGQKRPT